MRESLVAGLKRVTEVKVMSSGQKWVALRAAVHGVTKSQRRLSD